MKKFNPLSAVLFCLFLCCGIVAQAGKAENISSGSEKRSSELTGVTAKSQNNNILVSWGTSQEYDNEEFVIQRSEDNSDWNDIGLVHGTGGGLWPVSYCFVDTNINETVYFYRIKTVNGKQQNYSEAISVRPVVETESALFSVYPNPAKNVVWIKSLQPSMNSMDVTIYNSKGEQVFTSKIRESLQRIDLSDYKPGYYYIKTGTQMHKIYKDQ